MARRIALAKLLTTEEQAMWHRVWLQAGGPEKEIPLAAFIKKPERLVTRRDDPALDVAPRPGRGRRTTR